MYLYFFTRVSTGNKHPSNSTGHAPVGGSSSVAATFSSSTAGCSRARGGSAACSIFTAGSGATLALSFTRGRRASGRP